MCAMWVFTVWVPMPSSVAICLALRPWAIACRTSCSRGDNVFWSARSCRSRPLASSRTRYWVMAGWRAALPSATVMTPSMSPLVELGFQQVTAGTGDRRPLHVQAFVVDREDEAPYLRVADPDGPDRLEAVEFGHLLFRGIAASAAGRLASWGLLLPPTPQVDHRNVGLDPVHDLEELPAGPGLRHHLDVRRLAKDDPQAHADHRMVVGDDDAHRVMHLISPREASRELSPHSGGMSPSQW